MANTVITARKRATNTAKHGKPSVKTARKYGGKTKDRLAVEQRRRVMEYAKSLKAATSFHSKSFSAIEAYNHLRLQKGNSLEANARFVSAYQFSATERTPRKVDMGAAGNNTPRDPPTISKANEDDSGSGCEERLCKKDPPSEKNELKEDAHKTETAKMQENTHTSFKKEIRSRWDFLHRGLHALGIIGSYTNVLIIDTNHDDDGPFYDAVEEHLAEDSDDDGENRDLRCVQTCDGHSWVEPVDNTRFSKPDP